jgi:hypothetical protein
MRVDRKRLEQTIEELGRVGSTPRGGLTRLALTPYHGANTLLGAAMELAGRA